MLQYLEKKWVVGPFQCNCRLLVCPRTGDAVLVDPGDEASKILKFLATVQLPDGKPIVVRQLLHTHGHLDHIAATRAVKLALGEQQKLSDRHSIAGPIISLHRSDEPIYKALQKQGEMFGMKYDEPLPIDHFLEHEEQLQVGDLKFSVIHNPGHSPGSVSFRMHEDSALGVPESLLSGDTLFQGSVGRTDLWGSNQEEMFRNIHERMLVLDGDTRVCPGHGLDSTIAIEKRSNPFLI